MILPSSPSIPKSLEPRHLEKNKGGMFSAALTVDSFGNLGMELYFFSLHQSFGPESHMLQSYIIVILISGEQLNGKSSVAPTFPCFQFTYMTRFIGDRM